MANRRTLLVAAALVSCSLGCASAPHRPAASLRPPPARESRAGTRDPGAGPVVVAPTPTEPSETDPVRMPARPAGHAAAARRAVETARGLVGQKRIVVDGVRYGDGCAELVRAAFAEAGRPIPTAYAEVKALHALARREGSLRRARPVPGDLIFLSDRPGGTPDHVGLVEKVGEDGTVTVVHRTGRGVIRLRVNPGQPWKARGDDGKILNDVLLVGGGRVPAGRLVVAYATLL